LDRFAFHAAGQAFLIPTILASVALSFINCAILVLTTSVGQIFAHSSFEETFAAFATVGKAKKKMKNRGLKWHFQRLSH
jgi:hypothetical protein